MGNFITRFFNEDERRLHDIEKKVQPVLDKAEEFSKMSDGDLKAMTPLLKKRLAEGETLDDIYVDAFATAREACKRVIGEYPYPVQVMGATVLQSGNLAEMATGSGKTLTSVMAVYLIALEGKGVHVVTVNEYLAKRDAEWMGQIHRWLGLSVGLNLDGMTKAQKQRAYACDITYTTNSEAGFDYLRDNMVQNVDDRVMRGLHFALVDEADSILVDDARTPLIISGPANKERTLYIQANMFAKSLKPEDYDIDIKDKTIQLSESGVKKAENKFKVDNMFDVKNTELLHCINNALKANYIFSADVDYVVDKEGQEVLIVDPNTGRTMEGRQWSDGLHQAVEAKEGIDIKRENVTIATITYQNYFRLYDKLAGMTGTAKTEEDEFLDIYNMLVIQIPTNEPVIRKDLPDQIFGTQKGKYEAMLKEVKEHHATGQPILIGTISIESSEFLSKLLKKERIPHSVLNAKNHEREAEIIAKAGQKNAVTIATNMAGRGTDIKLGEGVKELGGLYVIGTERHESRRIDNQLRGRSGRQGDPGMSRFYISMQDELMQRFGNDQAKRIANTLGDECIESKSMSRSITGAQKRVEAYNYDQRKHLLQYDDVMRQQRETIYKMRDHILENENIHEMMRSDICRMISAIAASTADPSAKQQIVDADKMLRKLTAAGVRSDALPALADIEGKAPDEAAEAASLAVWQYYDAKLQPLTPETMATEKQMALYIADIAWMHHIDTMEKFRTSVALRGYAQDNPIFAYTNEGYRLFGEMMENIAADTAKTFIMAVNNSIDGLKKQKPSSKQNTKPKKKKKKK